MENNKAPENLTVYRKKGLTLFGGIAFLLWAVVIIGLFVFAYIKTGDTDAETKNAMVIALVGVVIFSSVMVINAALCFNNLRYRCILAADEKGLYDYSGFVHSGFIPWEDIQHIHGGGRKIEAFADLLVEGTPNSVKIDLKNYRRTFANRGRLWLFIYVLSGFGCTKIHTFCSPVSKKQTYALLTERYDYYTATDADK